MSTAIWIKGGDGLTKVYIERKSEHVIGIQTERQLTDEQLEDMASYIQTMTLTGWKFSEIIEKSIEYSSKSKPPETKSAKKLRKEIANDVFEKMVDMSSCPNERDIVIDIIENGERTTSGTSGKTHCSTDCPITTCLCYRKKEI